MLKVDGSSVPPTHISLTYRDPAPDGVPKQRLDLVATVTRAQASDQTAFDALYAAFADPLFVYLYTQCQDRSLAEELTGDLWVRVVERLPLFRFPPGSADKAFVNWLYRIARNLLIDAARQRRPANLPLTEQIACRDLTPEELLLDQEAQQALCVALGTLTDDQRAVLLLRFVERRSTREVATLLDRSEGAVRVLQYRAVAALARVLEVPESTTT